MVNRTNRFIDLSLTSKSSAIIFSGSQRSFVLPRTHVLLQFSTISIHFTHKFFFPSTPPFILSSRLAVRSRRWWAHAKMATTCIGFDATYTYRAWPGSFSMLMHRHRRDPEEVLHFVLFAPLASQMPHKFAKNKKITLLQNPSPMPCHMIAQYLYRREFRILSYQNTYDPSNTRQITYGIRAW